MQKNTPVSFIAPSFFRKAGRALGLALWMAPVHCWASIGKAQEAFAKGEYPQAQAYYAQDYQGHPAPKTAYNLGVSAYKSGQFEAAQAAFSKALGGEDLRLQGKVYYNLGNTLYRLGQMQQSQKGADPKPLWEQALVHYENALELKKKNQEAAQDVQFNYEFVKKQLERLKQESKEDPNPPSDSGDSDSQDKDSPRSQPKNPSPKGTGGNASDAPPSEANPPPQNPQAPEQSPASPSPDQDSKPPEKGSNPSQAPSAAAPPKGSDKEGQAEQAGAPPSAPKPASAADASAPQSPPTNTAPGTDAKDASPQQPPTKEPNSGESLPGKPGQMTRLEADALLDALREGEKKLPMARIQGAGGKDTEPAKPTLKDW